MPLPSWDSSRVDQERTTRALGWELRAGTMTGTQNLETNDLRLDLCSATFQLHDFGQKQNKKTQTSDFHSPYL